MATPPTLVASSATDFRTGGTTYIPTAVAVQVGDVVTVVCASEDTFAAWTAISDTSGHTWAPREDINNVGGNCCIRSWTTTATVNATITVTATKLDGAKVGGAAVFAHRGSAGVGATISATSSGAPSLGVTNLGDNSALIYLCADWSAQDMIGGRTYRSVNGSVGTEYVYTTVANQYSPVVNVWADAGAAGAKTVGLTAIAPGTIASMANAHMVIEIKGSGATAVVTRPRIPLHPPGPFRSPMGRKFPLPRPPRGQVDVSTGVTYDKAGGGVMDTLAGGDKVVGHEYAKTGGAAVDLTGGGADVVEHVKTGGATSDLDGGGAKTRERTKAGGATSDLDGGGARLRDKAKTGGALTDLDGGGAKVRDKPKTGGAVTDLDGGGARARDKTKTGGAVSDLDGGGAKTRERAKTGGAVIVFVAGGASARTGGTTYTKTGGATSALDGGGAKVRERTKAGGGTSDLDGGAARVREITKTGGGTFRWDGGGASAQGGRTYVKTGGAVLGAGSFSGGASLGWEGGGPVVVGRDTVVDTGEGGVPRWMDTDRRRVLVPDDDSGGIALLLL